MHVVGKEVTRGTWKKYQSSVSLTSLSPIIPQVQRNRKKYEMEMQVEEKKKPSAFQRGRRSRRSAYAFSHSRGYADLISSGRSIRRRPPARGGPQDSIREVPHREAENIWWGLSRRWSRAVAIVIVNIWESARSSRLIPVIIWVAAVMVNISSSAQKPQPGQVISARFLWAI